MILIWTSLLHLCFVLTLSPKQTLDSSKLKEFADDNFKFDENGRKSIRIGRKHCGKRRKCSLRATSPVFKRLVLQTRKKKGLFGNGLKDDCFTEELS